MFIGPYMQGYLNPAEVRAEKLYGDTKEFYETAVKNQKIILDNFPADLPVQCAEPNGVLNVQPIQKEPSYRLQIHFLHSFDGHFIHRNYVDPWRYEGV